MHEARDGVGSLVGQAAAQNEKAHRCTRWALPLLGSNQDSPDPEGESKPPEFQHLATFYASSCHPMLELAGLDDEICRPVLTQLLDLPCPP